MHPHDEETPHSRTPAAEKTRSTTPASFARTIRDVAPYLGLGIQLAATIVVCFFLGRWLDQVLNTTPWLMILGAFIGAAGGLYSFLKTVIELGKKEKERRRLERNAQR
jgi:F0F1-type ATP synthase assembly protein I